MNTLRFIHKVVFTVEIFDNSLSLNLYKQTNIYGDKKKERKLTVIHLVMSC